MKTKVKDSCIVLIYILIFASAFTYIRYTYTDMRTWRLLYLGTILGTIAVCFVYKIICRKIVLNSFMILMLLIIVYELTVSYFKSLFIMPMIFVDVIPWPFIVSVFYDYCKDNELPPITKRITMVGMTIICLSSIPNIIVQYTEPNGGAIFGTFYCVTFLPLVFLLLSRKAAVVFSVFVAFLMLFSFKRSAFLIVVIGLFLYYLLSINLQNASRKKIYSTLVFMVIVIAIILVGYYLIEKFGLNILSRLSNVLEDGGSGRIRIWNQVMSYFNASTRSDKWLGHGFHAVFYKIRPLGIPRYAHNSFLETLYDYGYIGLFLIVLFVFRIIVDTVSMIRNKHIFSPIMGFSVVSLLIFGFVSYFFEQSVIILPLSILWGTCIGRYSKEHKRVRKRKIILGEMK